jgi:signal transduction histidine kinase
LNHLLPPDWRWYCKVENKTKDFGDFFTEEDETIFKIIANVVALTIENARLHDEIEKQLKTISAKAAHRINNQAANYDGIELDLSLELQNQICNKDVLSEIHERLSKTTRNLKMMISEFRDFGKPLRLQKTKVSINKIIRNEVKLSKDKWLGIEEVYDENIPDFQIDDMKFSESVKELLSNAKKALKKNNSDIKTIRVSTKYLRESSQIVLYIEDNGPGFPQGFPIFEPFNSTDPQSTGLGLSTVKELVEKHGGSVSIIDSKLGGACVECKLPIT